MPMTAKLRSELAGHHAVISRLPEAEEASGDADNEGVGGPSQLLGGGVTAGIDEQSGVPDSTQRGGQSPRLARVCLVVLCLAILTYVLLFTRQCFYRFEHFGLTAFDLGIFDQAVWLISQGRAPFVTVRGMHILADHFQPILYLLAPLYWVWDSPKALLAVQTLALAMGAFPVYAFARDRLRSAPLALLPALCYLCYPAMQWTNTFDFHPEALATPLLLASFWLLHRRRRAAYFVLLVLAALTKETMGLTIAVLGVFALTVDRRVGWWTIGLGLLTQTLALGVVQTLNDGSPSAYLSLYSRYGHSPGEVVLTLARHPRAVLLGLNTEANRRYFFELLQPVFFLPLLAPEILLLAAPALLANLLSNRPCQHMIYWHYTVLITPFVILATIIGLDRLKRWGDRLSTCLLVIYLAVSVLSGLRFGPLLLRSWPLTEPLTSAQSSEAARILQQVPSDASVSAQAALGPHLSHRAHIYLFPNPFYRAVWGGSVQALRQQSLLDYPPYSSKGIARAIDAASTPYVVLQPPSTVFPLAQQDYLALAAAALRHPAYGIIAIGDSTILLRRGADHLRGLDRLAERSGVRIAGEADVERAFQTYASLGVRRSREW